MKNKIKAEARFALQVAVVLLDKYLSEDDDTTSQDNIIIKGKLVDALPGLKGFPLYELLDNWTFVYTVTYLPSCCAGECAEFDLEPIGCIDIITAGKNTYSFSLDVLTHYEWKA